MDKILAGIYITLIVIGILTQHYKAGKGEIEVKQAITSTVLNLILVYLLVRGFFL